MASDGGVRREQLGVRVFWMSLVMLASTTDLLYFVVSRSMTLLVVNVVGADVVLQIYI